MISIVAFHKCITQVTVKNKDRESISNITFNAHCNVHVCRSKCCMSGI